ncbi:MAG: uroporphyrinogen decarboxylase family protein [Oscillospiraceae bacterium]|nr:uroporphyrinogen decarboxylase family protein [Oscillospiraceae bacterium]
MTGRELINEITTHKSPGKVPYSIVLTTEAYEAYGDRLLAEYRNEQVMRDLTDGIISKPQAVSLALGNHLLYVFPPWWNWNITDGSFSRYDPPDYLPDTVGYGSYYEFFTQIKHIRENYDVYIIATIWGSHWEKAYFSRGIENFLADLAGNTEWAQALLDMIIRKNIVMLENFLTAPEIDAVLLGSDWGTQRGLVMSPECFKKMIKPGEKQEYDLIKKYGRKVFIHSCGNILGIMDDLVELGADCLNPIQPECMDIALLKSKYGSEMSFYGGISTQDTLPFGSPGEVRAETRKVIESMSVNGGYITAPSQEIQIDVPYENLRALIETAKEYI